MASDPNKVTGPAMICATKVMRPGGHRVGKLVGNITLPRTVPVVTAVLVGAGVILGGLLTFLVTGTLISIGFGAGIGGAIGYALATFSPLRGESMLTWLLLLARSRRRTQRVDGKRVSFGVGAAPANRVPLGPVMLARSAVRVNASARDDRGVLWEAESTK